MFELKVALVSLLCVPLLFVCYWLISKLIREVSKKNN